MLYVFGDYTLDMQRHELRAAGGVVQLDRQVFAVLAYLVQYRDRVVRRQELFEQLWPERFVSEAALERCIAVARRAVGDSGRRQRVIQTVHGRGYRFVAPVEERLDAPPCAALSATELAPDSPEANPLALPATVVSPTASVPLLLASPSSLPAKLPLPRQSLPAGERRQVTVLCGTLAYATALADRLGLAAFHHLVQVFHTVAQDCVQRYEGTIQVLREEGFPALFGVPVAQEDHAERAVRAALNLHQRLREALPGSKMWPDTGLTAQVGVHTGWVVAGSPRDESLRFVVVGGDTTQGAMHLQALAAPGTLLISDTTLRLLRGTVCSTPYGLVRVPGHTDPLMAYTVRGLEAPTATRLWSPFVGRQRELAILDDLLARVLRGQGQVVGLIGEPGIGKSRLLAAFLQRLPEQSVTVLEGHCRAYDRFLPYGPVRDLLLHQCGLSTTSRPEVVATRVARLLRTVDLPPEDSAPYLLQLLGSPTTVEPLAQLTPEVIKERTFATLRQVQLRSSQQQPLLLVVENLHWIDPTSEAYLGSLVEQLAGAPLLLLTTYRPGYRPLWMDKSYATQLTLPPLTREESATVVRTVLPPERSGGPLTQRVLARAAGNPLFLKELAHAVREQGDLGADTPVPETIQAVLAACIDHLPPEAKHLLPTAAVIGTEVPVLLLAALAELPEAALPRNLAHLQAAEFLYETRFVPERVYTFKHVLTHQVAYGSLLQERRRFLHARIVDILEALAPDRVAEQVDWLAHHAFQGGVWDKAVTYYRQAGRKAAERWALREAVAAFEQALEALRQLPDSHATREQAIDLRFDLRHVLLPLDEPRQIFDHLRQAEGLAEALGDQRRLGQCAGYLAFCLRELGDPDGSLVSARRALTIATALGDVNRQITANISLGEVYLSALSDYRRAAEVFRRTVEMLRDARLECFKRVSIPAVTSRASLAMCLAELGAFAEGQAHGEEALRLAEAAEHPYGLAQACAAVGYVYLRQGALPQAIVVLERGRAFSEGRHLPLITRLCTARLGAAYALAGRMSEALPLLEQALEQTMAVERSLLYPLLAVRLGEGYVLAGRMAEAMPLAQQALEAARTQKQLGYQAYALRLLGGIEAYGEPPDIVLAEASYRQALTLADELSMRPLQAHCYSGLGTLYAKIGQREQARAALASALELYRAMEMTFWLPEAESALAQVA
jgi:DNA-binding winged helix-turn-helix (wHTH) protein/class 3 adenylate cyclase/tetratricopeptide (TPR) repeat protein